MVTTNSPSRILVSFCEQCDRYRVLARLARATRVRVQRTVDFLGTQCSVVAYLRRYVYSCTLYIMIIKINIVLYTYVYVYTYVYCTLPLPFKIFAS